MFVVSEAEAAAIRTAFEQSGELAAAVELRRLFPGITDNACARARARTIAGWKPLPVTPRPVTALAPRQGSLERLPLLADHSAASAARIISARFAFVSGARALSGCCCPRTLHA
jgi:hypothetical protein